MNARYKALGQEQDTLRADARTILQAIESENREMTADELAADEARHARLGEIEAAIARLDRLSTDASTSPSIGVADKPVYSDLGTQLADVMVASNRDHADIRGREKALSRLAAVQAAATGAGETSGSEGGYLVQTDVAAGLLERTYSLGEVLSRCTRIPIGPNANGVKIPAVSESSRAAGSRYGGIRCYWVEEAGEITATQPKFRQIELALHKVAGLVYATEELLADTAALASFVNRRFPEELTFTVENTLIHGTGVGQPLGILNSGATVSVAAETSQVAATVMAANILKMWSRMWARSRANAVWFINQDVEPQLHQLYIAIMNIGATNNVGGFQTPIVNFDQNGQARIFGRPVVPVEYCSTLGTVGDVILADMSQYLVADKGGIKSAASMHVRFVYDEMAFRFTYRVDGQPEWNSALTPAQGSNTQSPFITLATRS